MYRMLTSSMMERNDMLPSATTPVAESRIPTVGVPCLDRSPTACGRVEQALARTDGGEEGGGEPGARGGEGGEEEKGSFGEEPCDLMCLSTITLILHTINHIGRASMDHGRHKEH